MSRNRHTVIEGNSKAVSCCGNFWKSGKVQLTGSHFYFICDKKGLLFSLLFAHFMGKPKCFYIIILSSSDWGLLSHPSVLFDLSDVFFFFPFHPFFGKQHEK